MNCYNPNQRFSSWLFIRNKRNFCSRFDRRNIKLDWYDNIEIPFREFCEQLYGSSEDLFNRMKQSGISPENLFNDINRLFYINPRNKKIYSVAEKPEKSINKNYFMDFLRNCRRIRNTINSDAAFDKFKELLLGIESSHLMGYPLNRALHYIKDQFMVERLLNPYENFAMVDGILCFRNFNYQLFTPVTFQNFKVDGMPIKIRRKYLGLLKKTMSPEVKDHYPVEAFATDAKQNCIFGFDTDGDIDYVQFKSGKFEVYRYMEEKLLSSHLPCTFVFDEYMFSDSAEEWLRNFFCNEKILNIFSKVVANAYTNKSLYKKALIINTNNANDKTILFFNRLFHYRIQRLGNTFFDCKPKDIYNYLLSTIFSKPCVYITESFSTPKNPDILRKLIKSTYFEVKDKIAGTLRFKNTAPVIILTRDETHAKELKKLITSEIINIDENFSTDKLSTYDYMCLRQALALYGLKLLSPEYKKTRQDTIAPDSDRPLSDKEIINSFIHLFCKKDNTGITEKSELRNAFSEYVSKSYPHFKSRPIAICNKLRDDGYDCTRKMRINGNTNPVHVILDLNFDREKFNDYLSVQERKESQGNNTSEFDVIEKFHSVELEHKIIFEGV